MKPSPRIARWFPWIASLIAVSTLVATPPFSSGADPAGRASADPTPVPSRTVRTRNLASLRAKFSALRWVAYAPTNFDPEKGVVPSVASLKADLDVLHKAGFNGLVTYGADLTALPALATAVGFEGMLLGVWDPKSEEELKKAEESAKERIVLGLVVGNEGLMTHRYRFADLQKAIERLKATGKPCSTTEVWGKYESDKRLREIGSFLAVNAHPFFHNVTKPAAAVDWTVKVFEQLAKLTHKPLLLKEVGLPTAGDPRVSEQAQAEYYQLLQQTKVPFVYFEAFDGPWKRRLPIEPHWGLFHSDRSPKEVTRRLTDRQRRQPDKGKKPS
jgi:exo-beta-1,3-glucanase (GH17 family)